MEEREAAETAAPGEETLSRDAPRLVSLLKEMKKALDLVRGKVEVLTSKVKENQYPTGDGISYLEAKHLLLLSYCQSIVYYVLRKANGLSIEGHPVVRSLVEIRLFLEKIRPIDKKHDYQIQKLMRAANNAVTNSVGSDEGVKEASQGAEDPLKYRPNPDMLVSKVGQAAEDGTGVYRPPRFAPTSMDEDNDSRKEKLAMRRERETLFRAKQSALAKELIDEIEGRPEEVREVIGTESQEVTRYKAKREERERQEEELFTRAPFTKLDKKMEKHLRKSRNGLLDLSDIYDDVRALPLGKNDDSNETNYRNSGQGGKRFKKRKMASGGSSRGDSIVRRQRVVHDSPVSQPALPLPLSSTSPAVGTSPCQSAVGSSSTQSWGRGHGRRGPTRGVTESRLEDGSRWNVKVIGGTGVGERGVSFVSKMGTVIRVHCKLWDENFIKLPETTKDAIFRDLQLCYEWERTPTTDRQMISHMTTMHRNWRGTLKQRYFKGKSFEDAIASVPAGVDPSEWQTMCEIWNTPERRRIAQRNQENRSHQSMAYSRGRISHTQMIEDFERTHQRTPHRMELFKMGRCHDLPDGTEHWVDEESSHRYERMTQMVHRPEGQVDDVPITHESAFIATMGRDRPGRIRCAGSAETLTSWYGPRESASTSSHRHDSQEVEQLKQIVLTQSTEMGRMRAEITNMREQMTLFMSQFRGSSSTPLIAPDPDPDDYDSDDDVDGGGDDDPTR